MLDVNGKFAFAPEQVTPVFGLVITGPGVIVIVPVAVFVQVVTVFVPVTV